MKKLLTGILLLSIAIGLIVSGAFPFVNIVEARAAAAGVESVEQLFASPFAAQALEVRNHLKNHDESFSVSVSLDVDDDSDAVGEIYNLALAHTGDPDEGDWLRYQSALTMDVSTVVLESSKVICIDFQADYYATSEQDQQAKQKADQIINYLNLSGQSEYEKILEIYNYIAQNVAFDYERMDDNSTEIEHSGYAALCENKAVCQGYAVAIYRLMLLAGIDCRIVYGDLSGEAHAWNLVRLNSKYYFLDATSDSMAEKYSYFLKTRNDLSPHIQDPDQLSACDFAQYRYAAESYASNAERVYWETEGFRYVPSLDGLNVIEYSGSEEHVVVPAQLNGAPVIRIAAESFHDKDTIKSIEFSEGIERLAGLFAFSCDSLETIIIPSTMKMETLDSFSEEGISFVTGLGGLEEQCYALKTIQVAKTNPWMKVVNGVLYNKDMSILLAYPPAKTNTYYEIPQTVTRINDSAFFGNKYIQNISIPDTVTYIGYWAFCNCTGIQEFTMPKYCTVVGQFGLTFNPNATIYVPAEYCGPLHPDMFSLSTEPLKLIIDENNERFKTKQNCVLEYTDDGEVNFTFYFPSSSQTVLNIPNEVTYITSHLFRNALNLNKIVIGPNVKECNLEAFRFMADSVRKIELNNNHHLKIQNNCLLNAEGNQLLCVADKDASGVLVIPDGIYEIPEDAAAYCWNLTHIVIPDGVRYIGAGAFHLCRDCTVIIPNSVTSIFEQFSYTMIIAGESGSCAEQFAKANNFRFVSTHPSAEYIEIPGVPPTCEAIGFAGYWIGRNGKLYADKNGKTEISKVIPIPAAGHDMYVVRWQWSSDFQRCYYWPACRNCNDGLSNMEGDVETAITRPATCEQSGIKTCIGYVTLNGIRYTDEQIVEIPALGHNFSKTWTIDIEPTSTSVGRKSHHCTRCDAVKDVTMIDMLPPSITKQPNGTQVEIGTIAQFSVAATGVDLTYQWQYNAGDGWKKSGATGATTATLSINAKTAYNGWKYRCIITDANGATTTSSVATLKIKTAITAQPADTSAAINEAAKFSVKATGVGLSYQWQYNSGDGWKNSGASGATTATLCINAKTIYNSWKYRCIITDANGKTATSATAKFTVRTKITAQPASVEAASGTAAKYTVKATGLNLTYQWQYNRGDGWKTSNGTGSKTDTLTINTAAGYNNYQYRCVITDANGTKTISSAAKLTVKTSITTQPNGVNTAEGTTAKFTVTATGAGLKYQWQYNSGDGWKNSGATGATTATLSINAKTAYNCWKYRCVITDANGATATSSVATLKIKTTITAQPNGYQATVNEAAKFTVSATGAGLTYQWQYNSGDGWKSSGASGNKTAELTIYGKTTYNGWQFRCVITDANGATTTSSVATLKIKTTITAQPASVEAASGIAANFTVKATGLNLSYQWQYNNGSGWKNSNGTGATTNTLTINAKSTYNNWQYRCVITDGNGAKTYSDAAKLTVK